MPSFVFEWLTASMGRPPLCDVFFSVVRVQRGRPILACILLRRHSREFDPLTADKFTRAVAADDKCHRRDGFDQLTKLPFAPPHGFFGPFAIADVANDRNIQPPAAVPKRSNADLD